MCLLIDGFGIRQIARKLNINESSVRDRIKRPIKDGLVLKDDYSFVVTSLGKKVLNACGGGVGVPLKSQAEKNQHSNEFNVKIKQFPPNWFLGKGYIDTLRAESVFYNKSSKQWYLYYQNHTVRISESIKTISFYIKKQDGNSFDEISSKVWDSFVAAFTRIKNNGFDLDFNISTPSPHFADPNGFFAMLASQIKSGSMKISTDDGDFWVDYSQGQDSPEEETDSEGMKKRMEALARSAFETNIDFHDLEKVAGLVIDLSKIVSNLVRLQANSFLNPPEAKKAEKVDYIG